MHNFFDYFDECMEAAKTAVKIFISPLNGLFDIASNFFAGAILIILIFAVLLSISLYKYRGNSIYKKSKALSLCAMLIAVNVILSYFTLNLSAYLRIGFGFITAPAAAYMFGPVIGGTVALLSDVVSFILKPTGGFLFTYTLNTAIGGMLCGLFLYKKKISFSRVFLLKLTEIIAVNIILNSIALAPQTGNGIIAILPARIVKNIILLPIQSIIVYEILKIISKTVKENTK